MITGLYPFCLFLLWHLYVRPKGLLSVVNPFVIHHIRQGYSGPHLYPFWLLIDNNNGLELLISSHARLDHVQSQLLNVNNNLLFPSNVPS